MTTGGAARTTTWRDLVELVRLPAVLTVPGDTLAGAAAAGQPLRGRTCALPVASALLYLAGMALNDYGDRDVDAKERPERPIPSGRVRPQDALLLAAALTAAGVGVATAAGGRRSLAVALPLAGAVWAYDLGAGSTPVGPGVMAAARGLDVLLGAPGRLRAALPAALAVSVHTLAVTRLSRGEVHGTSSAVAGTSLVGTASAAVAALVPVVATRRLPWPARVGAALAAGAYAFTVGRGQARAVRSPDAATVRTATGAGVRGIIPLQAALTAGAGSPLAAVGIVAAGPVARAASKVVAET